LLALQSLLTLWTLWTLWTSRPLISLRSLWTARSRLVPVNLVLGCLANGVAIYNPDDAGGVVDAAKKSDRRWRDCASRSFRLLGRDRQNRQNEQKNRTATNVVTEHELSFLVVLTYGEFIHWNGRPENTDDSPHPKSRMRFSLAYGLPDQLAVDSYSSQCQKSRVFSAEKLRPAGKASKALLQPEAKDLPTSCSPTEKANTFAARTRLRQPQGAASKLLS
jgi:hypothetical protein